MRSEFGYAWGKLYLATLTMATSASPLPQRVTEAFRAHLGSLNGQNLPVLAYQRLKVVRTKLSGIPDGVDDDETLNIAPLTQQDAALIAEEIFSLYDEIAQTNARSCAG
jgi:hypothetical protein